MELMGVRPARPTQISSEDLQKVAEKSIDLYSNDELTIFTKTNREDIIDYDG